MEGEREKNGLFAAIAPAFLACALAGPAYAQAVDPADRQNQIAMQLDQVGNDLLARFNDLADHMAARGNSALADRLRATGERLNGRLDALARRFDSSLDICAEA